MCAVEPKRVTPILRYIDIPVCFIHKQYENSIFFTKYEIYGIMLVDMCTKQCSGPFISHSTIFMTGFRFYTSIYSEHNQLMQLHNFELK